MAFDGRSLHEIEDEDLHEIFKKRASERRTVEFKATLNLSSVEKQREMLLDITSIANAEGGYYIVGVGEDGTSRAVSSSQLGKKEAQKIEKTISNLTAEHVSERIENLEIAIRDYESFFLVLLRIPKSSKAPHMVTLDQRSDFKVRHGTHKRDMKIGELRSAFNEDYFGSRLRKIEQELASMRAAIQELLQKQSEPSSYVEESVENSIESRLQTIISNNQIENNRFLWIYCSPEVTSTAAVDTLSDELKDLLLYPPSQRNSGWNLSFPTSEILYENKTLSRGNPASAVVRVFKSGAMEFLTAINSDFCWPQSGEEYLDSPQLNPYAVCEFPTSFIRFYRLFANQFNLKGPFNFRLAFVNINGVILRPGAPQMFGFISSMRGVVPFPRNRIDASLTGADTDFNPDDVAFELLKEVYAEFGLLNYPVPFYDSAERKFKF